MKEVQRLKEDGWSGREDLCCGLRKREHKLLKVRCEFQRMLKQKMGNLN